MYNIKTITEKLVPRKVVVHSNDTIEYILTDSRSLLHPHSSMFFALRTGSGDGHNYIEDLFSRGVRNFVVAYDAIIPQEVLNEANVLYVSNTLKALQKLASVWRNEFTYPVVAITGSNGKTVTKEFLYQLLSEKLRIIRSPRSYNSQLGVPLSVLKMRPSDELAIIEAGISQPAEMDRLENIIRPTYGIFTNIGAAHQENFTDLEEKIDEKLVLFENAEAIIYEADNQTIAERIAYAGLRHKAITWTRKNADGALIKVQCCHKYYHGKNLTQIAFLCKGDEYLLSVPFVDEASLVDILHCLTLVAYVYPQWLPEVVRRASLLEPVRMRLEVKPGVHGNVIINDTYNNDVNSLSIALDFLKLRAEHVHLKKAVILSDILQSSLTPKSLYRGIAEMIKKHDCELFIGIGKELQRYSYNFEGLQSYFFTTTEEMLESDVLVKISNMAVLVKGARQYKFEAITERLAEKGHETTLEVNLQSYVTNLNAYRALLPGSTKIMAMVKANAYGLGAYETALALEEAKVDYLGVAVADEGKELRQRGIRVPIVVMDPSIREVDTLIDYQLEPVIHSMPQFEKLLTAIDREGFNDFPVHLEFDTGMHRLGFSPTEAEFLAHKINNQHILQIKSVFTHLAAADDASQSEFTQNQITSYLKAYETLANIIGYRPIRHVLNTAGCERYSEAAFDMVRLGIGLYGVSPTKRLFLEPVVTLRTVLMQISQVKPGETIGYGRRGVLPNGGKVGIIPIGYADGYDRRFGNGVGKVVINGKVFPTIGSICMDLTMLDLSSALEGELHPGDDVTLIGSEKAVDLLEIADALGTIPYEVVANFASRIKRIYYKE